MTSSQQTDERKHTDVILQTSSTDGVHVPDGGLGWIIVLGSFMIHVIGDGISYSFGVFVQPLLEEFPISRAEVGWLGSIMIAVTWGSGTLSSILTDRFGCRSVVICGTLIATVGLIASTFAPNIWFMYASFGVLVGFGLGLMYLPSIIAVSDYFERRRSCAVGLTLCGAGVGTFIFAPLIQMLIDEFNWRGAILIEAAILLNGVVCGAVLRPLTLPIAFRLVFDSSQRSVSTSHLAPQFRSPVLLHHDSQHSVPDSNNSRLNVTLSSCSLPVHSQSTECGSSRSVFCRPMFVLFAIATAVSSFGFCVPFVFVPDRTVQQGQSEYHAAMLISIIGISNTVGRILCGYVSDFACVNRMILFWIASVLCGITSILSAFCVIIPTMVTYCFFIGLFMGAYICLEPTVLIDLMGIENLSMSFGITLLFGAIGALVGPPVTGLVYDATQNYDYSFYLMGCTLVISGGLMCCVHCIHLFQRIK